MKMAMPISIRTDLGTLSDLDNQASALIIRFPLDETDKMKRLQIIGETRKQWYWCCCNTVAPG